MVPTRIETFHYRQVLARLRARGHAMPAFAMLTPPPVVIALAPLAFPMLVTPPAIGVLQVALAVEFVVDGIWRSGLLK